MLSGSETPIDLVALHPGSLTRYPPIGKISESCRASPSSVIDGNMQSSDPTFKPDDCLSEVASSVAYTTAGCISNRPLKRPDNIFDRLLASSRSPNIWQSKRHAGTKADNLRPAFVYCGPGSRRIPGVSVTSAAKPKTNESVKKHGDMGALAIPQPVTRRRLLSRPWQKSHLHGLNDIVNVGKSKAIAMDGTTLSDKAELPPVSIRAVGDDSRKSTSVSTLQPPVEMTPGPSATDHIKKDTIISNNEPYTALWRGPEFIPVKSSNWTFVSDFKNMQPSSDDVILSGLVFQPATFFQLKGSERLMLVDPEKVLGFVRVHNHAYEKSVTIRASYDKWHSYIDQPAKYIMSTEGEGESPGKYDIFAFRFNLPEGSDEFEFAIHYRWWKPDGCGSRWDNNGAQNYLLRRNECAVETNDEPLDSIAGGQIDSVSTEVTEA